MKKILIIVIPALFLYGCGVWNNFTTYFNLYYNSSDLFSKAEKSIKDANNDVFSIEPMQLPTDASTNINKVIEKCSQILQFHANSSYVDDALLMIGKCFYYQTNYQKALRKFKELLSTQPNSDLVLEANLWTGMTQMGMRDYDNAMNTLQDVMEKARQKGNKDILELAYIEEIKYDLSQKDDASAITLLENFLKTSENNEINAEAAFKLGLLYKDEGELPSAINSFKRVNNYSPSYFILLNSMIELGKTLRENSEYQNALDLFNSMRSESKYADDYDKIEVQSGITLVKMNKLEDAIQKLTLVDTTYSKTPSSGLAEYELAKIFQNDYSDFDSADYYYKKSLSHQLPPEYMQEVRNQVELIGKYDKSMEDLKSINKDISYIQNPELFIEDSLAYSKKIDEEKKLLDKKNSRDKKIDTRFMRNNQIKREENARTLAPQRPKISLDSLQSELIKTKFELGNILFTEFNLPDSAIKYYNNIIVMHPNSFYHAKVLYAIGSYYLVKNDSVKADSLFNVIYDNYKNQDIVNAAANKLNKPYIQIHRDPAQPIYANAEKQLDSDKYDSSLVNLYGIYENHPKSTYAPKALYTYGWILENKLNLPDSAAAVYDTLSKKYPNTVYANSIKAKLAFYLSEKTRKLEPDSAKEGAVQDTAGIKGAGFKSSEKPESAAVEERAKEIKTREKELAERRNEEMKNNAVQNPDTLIRVMRRYKQK